MSSSMLVLLLGFRALQINRPVFHEIKSIENIEAILPGEDQGVSHEVSPGGGGGHVVK